MKDKDGHFVPVKPDKGWNYDKTNRLAGVQQALSDKMGMASGVLKSATEKRLESNSMENATAQTLLNNLINNAEKATGENKLKQLWTNPENYNGHIDKRIRLGHISSKSDYEARTFDVLANAKKITVAIPATGDMISGKLQLVADGWAVLTTHDGRIITSYGFEKDKPTFEQNEIKHNRSIYEHTIRAEDRKILKRVFNLS